VADAESRGRLLDALLNDALVEDLGVAVVEAG
jgi:hypothetical protein